MKRLRSGSVNTLSFIKTGDYIVNDFTIKLEKVVGTQVLELTGLSDSRDLDSCSDFVTINVDLITNELDGGEYLLYLTNGTSTQKYLANVDVSEYINTSQSGIYGSTVVLSQITDSGTSEEGGTTNGGSSEPSTVSFQLEVYDNESGTLEGDIQLRTDTWSILARATNSHSDIEKFRAVLTDSSGNTATKVTAKDSNTLTTIYFVDINNESINFGDVGTLHYEGLDANDNVLYTSSIRTVYIPAKVQMYVAESLADANDMQLNGRTPINHIESVNTETYNLYVYVEENYGSLTIDFQSVNAGTDSSVYPVFGFNPPSFSGSNQVMTEVATNVRPSLATGIASVTTYFVAGFEWSDGNTTPTQAGFYAGDYSAGANKIVSTPYAEDTITIDGDTFTLKGYSPIVFNNAGITTNDPTVLRITVGDGNYNYDLLNRTAIVKVQQGYTDGTILEETITSNFSIIGSPAGSSFDYNMYITQLDTNKTADFTKVWTKSKDGNWYNINNSSSDAPHFRFDH